ncbi:hypothetical protein C8Q78DRAFT_1076985 [Trametes maxima]|nr:hypothetical protein C8Q78DRAFT_1076985 [Trametes maxima]
MSTKNDGKSAHPNAPRRSEPHGISFTLVQPTPPTSPNLAPSFPSVQTILTKSKLPDGGKSKTPAKKSS